MKAYVLISTTGCSCCDITTSVCGVLTSEAAADAWVKVKPYDRDYEVFEVDADPT